MTIRAGADTHRSAVLAHLGATGPSSRATLARRLGVSAGLITAVARELIADGLVEEGALERQSAGRPARLLRLAGEAGRCIGAKLVTDHVTLVEVGTDGRVTRTVTEPWVPSSPTALRELAEMIEAFRARGIGRILGVGVGVPGQVADLATGAVTWPAAGWHGTEVGATLAHETGLPVIVDNNVNAVALAERLFGHGRRYDDFLEVTIGEGIGAAIVRGGEVQRGATGGAGELGHVPVDARARCECGNVGCLEAVIGERALVAEARAVGVIGVSEGIDAVASAADGGDEAAERILAAAGHLLGRTLAGVVNVLDPAAVVVTGEGAPAWRHWMLGFEPAFRAGLMPARRDIRVEVESWQDDRWAQGAAALVLGMPFDRAGAAGAQGREVRARMTETP